MHTIQTRSLNMSSNCLCMCFSTMRLLLNVSCGFAMFDYYCTIYLLNLLCFTTAIRLVLAFLFQSTTDHDATNLLRRDLLLHSTMSTEERRKPEANIQSLTRISIRTMRILSNRIGAPSLDHFRVPMVFFYNTRFH